MWIYYYDSKPTLSFIISMNIKMTILWSLRRWTNDSFQWGFSIYFGVEDCHSISHFLDRNLWWYEIENAMKNLWSFFSCANIISLLDYKIWFRMWMKEKHQCILVLMTNMCSNFFPYIWSIKHSKLMGNERMLIGWSCAM